MDGKYSRIQHHVYIGTQTYLKALNRKEAETLVHAMAADNHTGPLVVVIQELSYLLRSAHTLKR